MSQNRLLDALTALQEARDEVLNNPGENRAVGENGTLAYASPLNDVLALYTQMGSSRFMDKAHIHSLVNKAFKEDPKLTLACILKCLDIRGGMGERRAATAALNELERLMDVSPYLEDIVLLSRWDILFQFRDKKVLNEAVHLIYKVLTNTHENEALLATHGLLCKWLPRKPKTVQERYVMGMLRTLLGVSPKDLRRYISDNSNTVEQFISSKKWSEVNYEHVPSVAMNRLRKAFERNDEERYEDYVNGLVKGEKKINAGVLFPHDIFNISRFSASVHEFEVDDETQMDIDLANSQWKALPNFFNDVEVNILPMLDLSDSMWINLPGTDKFVVDAAVALSMYCSERVKGPFKNNVLAFAEVPELVTIDADGDKTPYERYKEIHTGKVGYATNFNDAYRLILETAKQCNLTDEDMPEVLLVVSDMQFDACSWNFGKTTYELLKQDFANAGYKLPKLVFWNMRATGRFMVTAEHEGVCEISGYSPSIMKDVLASIQDMTPMNTMVKGLEPYFKYMKTFNTNHVYRKLVSREEIRATEKKSRDLALKSFLAVSVKDDDITLTDRV